jgi:D-3-phosphoglycerate dehydrogenase
MAATSFPKDQIKVLLLENVAPTALDILSGEGFQIEALKQSLPPDELAKKIADVHVLGIRSKTQVPRGAF